MEHHPLTQGICRRLAIASPDTDHDGLFDMKPVVQLLSIKKVNTSTSTTSTAQGDRYRVIISDGDNVVQSMLATQLNHLVEDGTVDRFVVGRLDKFTVNIVQNKRLTIILGITIMERKEDKIGNPVTLDANVNNAANNDATTPNVESHAPPPRPPQQVRQTKSNGGEKPPPIFPIEHLSPYNNKWTIKARVTQKSDIRTWSNNKGEGKLFSVSLMDETGEIKATAFNTVVDDFFERIQEGKVYFISRARVGLAKKKFSNIQNEYELTFERNTEIEECLDVSNVPQVKYNFIELGNLQEIEKDSVCDVIGVVKEISDLSEIVTKATQKTLQKRELTLVDRSNFSVRLTLWGKQAESFTVNADQPVIAFKGVRIGDYGGRSLSAQSSSTMSVNPDMTEAHALRGWFDSVGINGTFQSHSSAGGGMQAGASGKGFPLMFLADVKGRELGSNEKTDFFAVRVTTMHIKPENMSYPACPSDGCNKKVIETHDGWRCEKCDKMYPDPEHRYIISMAAADVSDQAWLQGFNDVGSALFGMSANELISLKEQDDRKYQRTLRKGPGQKYVFDCRAKTDSYNEMTRIRYGIIRFREVDFKEQCLSEIDIISAYPVQV